MAAGSQAGDYRDGHAVLYAAESCPAVTVDKPRRLLKSVWLARGNLAYEVPPYLLELDAVERRSEVHRLTDIARASAEAATTDPAIIVGVVENFAIYIDRLCSRDVLKMGDGARLLSIAEENDIEQAVLKAAQADGREADFGDILLALAQQIEAKRNS